MQENFNFNNNSPAFDENQVAGKYKKEINNIIKVSFASGLCLIMANAIYYFWSDIAVFMGELLGFEKREIINFLISPAVILVVQIVVSSFAFIFPFVLIYKLFKYRISDLISFKKTEKGLAVTFFFFGVAFCAFSNIVNSKIDSFFRSMGSDSAPTDFKLPDGVFGFILNVIASCVIPALVEEFAFRGVILGSLRKHGDGFAILTSSVLFGLIHGNLKQIPFAFLLGLFLGFCTVRTGSIRVAMCVHFYNNFFSVVFSDATKNMTTEQSSVVLVIYMLLALVLGVTFLINCKKDIFTLEKDKNILSFSKRILVYFTTVPIILFSLYSLEDLFKLIYKVIINGQ